MKITVDPNTNPIGAGAIAPKPFSFLSGGGGGGTPTDVAQIIALLTHIANKVDTIHNFQITNDANMAAGFAQVINGLGAVVAAINAHP